MGLTRRTLCRCLSLLLAAALAPASFAQWVHYVDETATRLVSAPGGVNSTTDPDEKSYCWADFDRDGDIDLAVVRKEGWTTPGKRPAVLLMNQGGVLTDRTTDFATATDVSGDMGFKTPTNNRNCTAVDVDLDGWLDIVTAPTISPGDPKHIGHPRVYHNRGCSGPPCTAANWLGFRFENSRIPTMLSSSGQAGFNPCFCHVHAGDITGDGYPELWFIDYDTGCGGAGDFNNKLLINQGAGHPGFFTDGTNGRFTEDFPDSAFGASGKVIDVNGDGKKDLIKQFAGFVGNAFNDPANQGFFHSFNNPYSSSAYFMNTGDLNNDGKVDMIISDDGADRYLLNQGNGGDDMADFLSFTYSFLHTGVPGPAATDDGFGGGNIAADLNKDGWQDVLITDVDVDISGCDTRRMHIYKNLGGTPGGFVTLQEQTTGSACANFQGNPATCLVASIPANKLKGVHDVAVFDINGDTWPDLVVGRCSGTQIYMNQPPVGPAGGVPDGGTVPGTMLTIGRLGTGQLELNWGASCTPLDTDYSVYQGTLGATLGGPFTSHAPVTCTTLGATSINLAPPAGSFYYLIVPHNGTFEGSYGNASNGTPRQQGTQACHPMLAGGCN